MMRARHAAILHHRQRRRHRNAGTTASSPRPPAGSAIQLWMPYMPWPLRRSSVGRALGMGDAAPRRHQIHLAGHDLERIALAVAVHDLAVEQVGHRREPDMGVRAHVHAVSGDELHRAHLVEEDERPHHLALAVRQRAAHLEAAEIAHPRHDRELQRIAGALVAEHGVFVGHPAHGGPPSQANGCVAHRHMAAGRANGKTRCLPLAHCPVRISTLTRGHGRVIS